MSLIESELFMEILIHLKEFLTRKCLLPTYHE